MESIRIGRRPRGRGFTLVETTTVIAIVGTLAATALPRMIALEGEARYVSLDSARAALSTVATLSHAKFLINGRTTQTFQDSTVALVEGYPAANQATADAAGLRGSFVVYTRMSGSGATAPPVYAGAMSLVPKGIAGTARSRSCFLVYEQASAAHPVPRIRMGGDTSADTCS
jgi:prepilin-type N-terminal cleavage/methylation domain-containing protein